MSTTSTVGFAFGSPALVGWRGTLQEENSPWTFQGEFSSLILDHNRSDGRLTTLRLDAQWEFTDWDAIKPYCFSGAHYFTGYLNDSSPTVSLPALGFGLGVVIPVHEKWSMTGELGAVIPTQALHGFEFFGLIINLGIRWRWLNPQEKSSNQAAF